LTERLQKVLAAAGIASRRRSEELIAGGRVRVNGQLASVGQRVDGVNDIISVDGVTVDRGQERYYLAFHKPIGFTSSLRSTHGEPTIFNLLDLPVKVFPVGRLDRNTSGLLLVTNDGEWANVVTHPRYGIEKEYRVIVEGAPNRTAIRRMREGVRLPDGTLTAPANVSTIAGERNRLSIVVRQGKKRQIRLMAEAVGHPVLELVRVRIDGIKLENLQPGEWRSLAEQEVVGVWSHAR
jgi:23S rRNA pseudouridine2605 synthase